MQKVPRGAVRGAVRGADGHPDLRTSDIEEEEEEGRCARSALAPLAATPPPPTESQVDSDAVDEAVLKVAADIAKGASVPEGIDPGRYGLGREMVEAKARAGWDDEQLVDYCVAKLLRKKPNEPTAWLATDLRTRVTATLQKPPPGAAVTAKPVKARAKEPTKRSAPAASARVLTVSDRRAAQHRRQKELETMLTEAQEAAEADGTVWEQSPCAVLWSVRLGQPVETLNEAHRASGMQLGHFSRDSGVNERAIAELEAVMRRLGLMDADSLDADTQHEKGAT
jgi:hypothetical protein